MKVAFRVDASARIGGGHVMRCLTLADAVKARGAETLFIAAAIPPVLAERINAAGHALHVIERPDGLDQGGDDWENQSLLTHDQAADASRTLAAIGQRADWLVVDHYLLDADWHREARPAARSLMVIDDLANRRLDCDLLLDQTLGRTAKDYAPLVPDGTPVLLGASYALLRPEFARERPGALARRRAGGPVRRILLSLGTTDLGGVTGAVLQAILPVTPDQAIDVVLDAEAQSRPLVRAMAETNPRVLMHLDANNMAELMREADLAIGAAGTTSWERCCLGLPSLVFVLANNQALIGKALEQEGANLLADVERLPGMLRELLDDEAGRRRMAEACASVTDGLGAERAANAISHAKRDRAA